MIKQEPIAFAVFLMVNLFIYSALFGVVCGIVIPRAYHEYERNEQIKEQIRQAEQAELARQQAELRKSSWETYPSYYFGINWSSNMNISSNSSYYMYSNVSSWSWVNIT
jgi:type II secretory pathway pseudopilin PulG